MPDLTREVLALGVERIRIIFEGDEKDDRLLEARDLIKSAGKICVLGFGYHHENMKRLSYPEARLTFDAEVFACRYGVPEGEMPYIKKWLNNTKYIGGDKTDALGVLHQFPVLT